MPLPKPHRKRVQHFDGPGEIHELTFSCYHRWPILDNEWRREHLSHAIDRALENHGWRLAAFVFMPEHVHLIIYPALQGLKIEKLLFGIKRPFIDVCASNFTSHVPIHLLKPAFRCSA